MGFDTSDDACVYRITDEIAAIHTVDFFTPIVDDPFWFGQIAAANALSDVYAMGGRPAVAMNLLCVPGCLSQETVRRILEGGHQKAVEAGYWHTYRFDPRKEENAFTLDSKAPSASYRDFIMNEVRYNSLTRAFPERAEKLFAEAEKAATEKYEHLVRLSALYAPKDAE